MYRLTVGSRPALPAARVRAARRADHRRLVELLVAQFREHRIRTPIPRIARAVDGVLRHPERGRLLVATVAGRPIGLAALSGCPPVKCSTDASGTVSSRRPAKTSAGQHESGSSG